MKEILSLRSMIANLISSGNSMPWLERAASILRADMQNALFGVWRINDVITFDKLATVLHFRQQCDDFAGRARLRRGHHQSVIAQVLNSVFGNGRSDLLSDNPLPGGLCGPPGAESSGST